MTVLKTVTYFALIKAIEFLHCYFIVLFIITFFENKHLSSVSMRSKAIIKVKET